MSIGRFFFSFLFFFFFFQEKNPIPSGGENGVWIRNYRLLVRQVILKVCIEGKFGIMMGADSFLRVSTLKRLKETERLF